VPGRLGQRAADRPLAIVDKPFEQRRDLLVGGPVLPARHAIVVGAPQSASNAAAWLVSVLALTHTPKEARSYLLDMGGRRARPVTGFPPLVR